MVLNLEKIRTIKTSLDNHLRTSSHISRKTANHTVEVAKDRLGDGGIFGVLRYDSKTQRDPRWDLFVKNLSYDSISTNNGIYIPQLDVLAVHGQEVQTEEGHDILVIGHLPDQTICHGTPIEKMAELIDNYQAIGIVAAPYSDKGAGRFLEENSNVIRGFHGIETFSGEAEFSLFGRYPEANVKAEELFKRLKEQYSHLFSFVGDDGHSIRELGKTYAVIEMPQDYTIFRNNPLNLVSHIIKGYTNAKEFKKTSARLGALNHILDLAILIGTSKLGLDPNTQTAPLLERFGIQV